MLRAPTGFARLASGAFYETIVLMTFYEIINHKEEEIMLKSVEAIIEKNGEVRLQEPIHLSYPCRAIVTILDEKSDVIAETALLSEAALSEDWNRPEEEEAWSHLQKVR